MKEFIANYILKNWQYKIMALFVAVGMWLFVVREQEMTVTIDVPVEFINYPETMKVTGNVQSSVKVQLEGRKIIINQIDKKTLKIIIDLKKAVIGKNSYQVLGSRFKSLPRGIFIRDISPAYIYIDFTKEQPPEPAEVKDEKAAAEKTPVPKSKKQVIKNGSTVR
ncbi:MAG: hypothetical protein CVV21_07800 [Candidatus Goldiibacteriota bacterium HGW-Goldbacteria-1]|jgi:YbbR domain-containing protein|nr:MAG: hypothetical protein CVV21_07800 [Candidatus Goldiibacteriota bacterium HGW-Goldbacteria-1]